MLVHGKADKLFHQLSTSHSPDEQVNIEGSIHCLVTRSTLLPLVVLIYPLVVLVCPLIVLVCLLVVSVCPLVVMVVQFVALFITNPEAVTRGVYEKDVLKILQYS